MGIHNWRELVLLLGIVLNFSVLFDKMNISNCPYVTDLKSQDFLTKKVELGYIVQFNFDLSTEGYLRFYCYEFSIETVGEPLQSGGNDNLIEDF